MHILHRFVAGSSSAQSNSNPFYGYCFSSSSSSSANVILSSTPEVTPLHTTETSACASLNPSARRAQSSLCSTCARISFYKSTIKSLQQHIQQLLREREDYKRAFTVQSLRYSQLYFQLREETNKSKTLMTKINHVVDQGLKSSSEKDALQLDTGFPSIEEIVQMWKQVISSDRENLVDHYISLGLGESRATESVSLFIQQLHAQLMRFISDTKDRLTKSVYGTTFEESKSTPLVSPSLIQPLHQGLMKSLRQMIPSKQFQMECEKLSSFPNPASIWDTLKSGAKWDSAAAKFAWLVIRVILSCLLSSPECSLEYFRTYDDRWYVRSYDSKSDSTSIRLIVFPALISRKFVLCKGEAITGTT